MRAVARYIGADGRRNASMNIFDKGFAPAEAVIRYLDGDYVVLKPGSFVRCAITGKPIPLDELFYWNVDRQEAYADAVDGPYGLRAVRPRSLTVAEASVRRRFLFISNGHGEDCDRRRDHCAPAHDHRGRSLSHDRRRQCLCRRLPDRRPARDAWPRRAGATSRARCGATSPPAGSTTVPPALSFLRKMRGKYDRVVVVGDMTGVLAALATGHREL